MDNHSIRMLMGASGSSVAPGQVEYLTPGTYPVTVQPGVFFWSVVSLQGGDGGSGTYGGDGGDLRYTKTPIQVTPGEVLTVVVGAGGAGRVDGGSTRSAGVHTTLSRGATLLFSSAFPLSATIGGGNGGVGAPPYAAPGGAYNNGGGGGGAGGYSGNGGNGRGASASTDGTGGGGGGGGRIDSSSMLATGGYGGGVGVRGEGANGAASVIGDGLPGSNGSTNGRGGNGGYRSSDGIDVQSGGSGGPGAFRAVWGDNRSYPSTNTANM